MKKNLTIFFISLFLFTIKFEVKSCPEGSTYSIFNFTIDNCVFEAIICWKCPVGLGSEHWISVDYFKKVDPNCNNGLSPSQILNAIYSQVNSAAWIWGLCGGGFPPCNTPQPYSIIKYNCWYISNNNGNLSYAICDYSSWCQWDGTICWNELTGPERTEVRSWYQVGTINCSPFWPPAPPPGQSSICGVWQNCP